MQKSLTQEIIEFKKTGLGIDDIIERIAIQIYQYPRNKFNIPEDDNSDFFLYFYPKIPKMIYRFQYTGRDFESYLLVSLKYQLKTFLGKKAKQMYKDKLEGYKCFWDIKDNSDITVHEKKVEYTDSIRKILNIDNFGHIKCDITKKRVKYLALKNAHKLDENYIKRIAHLIDENEDTLRNNIINLNLKLNSRNERYERLTKRRNTIVLRIYKLHIDIFKTIDIELKNNLHSSLAIEKERLSNCIYQISKVGLAPKHSEIADVLGVPKGSIDSSIHYLKKSFSVKEDAVI